MKKWNDLASLGLLDDGALLADLPERAWEELVHKAAEASAPPKIVAPLAPNPLREALAEQRKRVFSSKPTLRQMMAEYNRPTSRTAPIKTAETPATQDDFDFQAVDLIQIPVIPGKILRPARSPGDADA